MSVFFFNDPAPTEIYTLSLHTLFRSGLRPSDARNGQERGSARCQLQTLTARKLHSVLLLFQACETHAPEWPLFREREDRKSTRLNSSHSSISYAVFCLKKKNKSLHHI